MKIALVSYWCIPYSGGVSTYTLALRKGLEELGHEVDIISHNETGMKYHIVDKGKTIDKPLISEAVKQNTGRRYNIKMHAYDAWLADMESERIAFRQALSHFRLDSYDLIHAQDVISAIGAYEVKPSNIPLLLTLHGDLAAEWQYQRVVSKRSLSWEWAKALDHYGRTAADQIVFPSRWLKRQYDIKPGRTNSKAIVIPYGFDTIKFLHQSALFIPSINKSGSKLILCPARLDPVKGHYLLLEALYKLKELRSDWICWLAGEGPMRKQLEHLVSQLGLGHQVSFLGHQNNMALLLQEADLIVLPSIHDNLPFAVMEAQVAGKPIIASDTGGIPEMIDNGKTGLLFPSGKSDLLCRGLNQLLSDEDQRKKLANQARYHGLRNWSLQTMINRTILLYEKAIASKRADSL
ncbi:glycosyltransferase family 4 protein [Paenibacillus sp. BK720]|uniref:glycosyltransferase family 4 protein n=1 Tax=Paenibacillus sp. BK720 TaxID=2587092 RepID=UPI0014216CCC|nr:glycosyltransferase family 4 protein [Paenibacillus sp. BK720]NIK68180.1 glycosyltransferase involved in cell wall biosynthesis [Paenibacillus sp. BK720]